MSSKKREAKPPRIQDITVRLRSGREVTGRFINGQLELDGPILTEEEITPEIARAIWTFVQRMKEKRAAKETVLDSEADPPAPHSTGTGQCRAKRGES